MTKATYNVANTLDAFDFERLVIIHAVEDGIASVFYVTRDGDHCGLFYRIPLSALYGFRTAELLA